MNDDFYMDFAIKLALKGEGKVNPNPLVGAVIVKNNKIIGSGYHEQYGKEHAERNAVKSCNKNMEGSTIYVTLEPCFHFGRQPPCVDMIIEKKIRRVVIGMIDPNPLVSGKSIEKLRENNIEVTVGVREKECKKLNEIFIKYITSKIPFVLLKAGMSLDGKIATYTGESKWITCEESRKDAHNLRNKLYAIMVGINTVILDDPELTCRIKGGRNPIKIIVDSSLRIPIDSKVVKINPYLTIIATTEKADENKKRILEDMGISIITTSLKNNKVDLSELLQAIGEKNIDSILIEGGSELNFSALEEGIVDKIRFYIAPKILGGDKSKSSIGGQGFSRLYDCINLNEISYKNINDDLIVEGYIKK